MANIQNYKTHTRFHPLYHYFLMPVGLFGLIYSGIRLAKASPEHHLDAMLLFLAFVLLFCTIALVRIYSLKVQDRVIRTEENFRHFLLTGKPLDPRLKTSQVVALRFASDEEFVALAERALKENLGAKEIKVAIVNWRADYRRV
jgi:hypothetical protein